MWYEKERKYEVATGYAWTIVKSLPKCGSFIRIAGREMHEYLNAWEATQTDEDFERALWGFDHKQGEAK